MASKHRCSTCKDYFIKEDMIRWRGSNFCTDQCKREKQFASKKPKKPKPPVEEIRDITSDERRAIKERDAYCCRSCGVSIGLEVHHIRYRSEYPPDVHSRYNLVTLCEKCHALVHSNKKKYQPALLAMVEYIEETKDQATRLPRWVKKEENEANIISQ